MIAVTRELLNQGLSDKGALNYKQMLILGHNVARDGWPRAGWKNRAIGKLLTEEQRNEFLRLKNTHLKENKGEQLSLFH